jgi:alanine racemase
MPAHRLISDVRRAEELSDGPGPVAGLLPRIRPTRAEIDLDVLVQNAARIKQAVGAAGVLAVVKADGYGHGAVPAALALVARAPIAGLAVSLAEEGIELRQAGIKGPVLVMGAVYGRSHRDVAEAGLTPVVSELEDIEAFGRLRRPLEVHLKLDTGMARLGVRPAELDAVLGAVARFPGLRVAGFMTHLASADTDARATRLQLERFEAAWPRVRARVDGRVVRHAANSAAIALHPEAHLDAVRPGLALYGGASPGVMRFSTGVAQLREIATGETVSYGGTFRAARPSRIATLPVGYADGYPRRLSSDLQPADDPTPVLIGGRRCPVVGAVCMDMLMVDVTDLPAVARDDEAVLLGRQGAAEITAAELARRAGLIEYEITCGISKRVPRLYAGVPSPPTGDEAALERGFAEPPAAPTAGRERKRS